MHRAYPSHQGMTRADSLLYEAVEALDRLFELTRAINSEDGKYAPPKPRDRPGQALIEARAAALAAGEVRRAREFMDPIIAALLPPDRR